MNCRNFKEFVCAVTMIPVLLMEKQRIQVLEIENWVSKQENIPNVSGSRVVC